jgi:DDE superfamily endonuclease
MAELSSPLMVLQAFRAELYACCTRRTDALLELADALLCAPAIPSVAHLSLEPTHRRGWGSAYAALASGRVDVEQVRDLLVHHPLDGGLPIYAVDATCWARCDANCSPQRAACTTTPRGTRPANRSWPAGRTSGSPSSASPGTPGPRR